MGRRRKIDTSLIKLDKGLLQLLVCAWRYELMWLKQVKKSRMRQENSKFLLLNNNYSLFLNKLKLNSNFLEAVSYPGVYSSSMNKFNFDAIFNKNISKLFNYNIMLLSFQPIRLEYIKAIEQLLKSEDLLFLNGKVFNKIVSIEFFCNFIRYILVSNGLAITNVIKVMNFFFIRQFCLLLRYQMFMRISLLSKVHKN